MQIDAPVPLAGIPPYSWSREKKMNNKDSVQPLHVTRALLCGDGLTVHLATDGDGREFLLLPASGTPLPSPSSLPGSLLARPDEVMTTEDGALAAFALGGRQPLALAQLASCDIESLAGIACDLLEALLSLHLAGQATGALQPERLLLDSHLQLTVPLAVLSHADADTMAEDLRQAGKLFYWLFSGRRHSSLPLQRLKPDLAAELAALVEEMTDGRLAGAVDSTRQLLARLQDWLAGRQRFIRHDGDTEAALQQLLHRMRHSQDFPALSQAVSAINHIGNADSERLQVLAEIILKDFSLTNKLLKVVNSANFSQFGGTVSTVSRAIVILGFDTIRNLALTLLLFEHMHNRPHAQEVKDVAIKALFCGLMTRALAQKAGQREVEEALICGMFQQLGELLCVYYFREEYRLIQKKLQAGSRQEAAVKSTLGIGYADFGGGTAALWSFPERIVRSIEPLGDEPVRQPQHGEARLRVFSHLARELTELLSHNHPDSLARAATLLRRYERALPMTLRDLEDLIHDGQQLFTDYLRELDSGKEHSPLARQLRTARIGQTPPRAAAPSANLPPALEDSVVAPPPATSALLSAGIQDITSTLLGNYQLNDLLRMILETMFRAVGFDHVLLCTRDVKLNQVVARFGFGDGVDGLLKSFRVDLAVSDNAFCIAMDRNVDIFIEDATAPEIAAHIPPWFRQLAPGDTFIVFPLVLDKRKIGFLYGDRRKAHSLPLKPDELNLLKTMRNQALLAIKQKQN